MTEQPTTVGGGREGIQLRIDTKGLADAFARGPSTSYYWLRGFLFGAFLKHRVYWLRAKSTRFGRGGKGNAIKVWKINEAPAGERDNWVVYRVNPRESRERDPGKASALLRQLQGSAFAGSIVLEVHQQGRDINVPEWMAIPLRTRERTPKAWRAKNPGKPLLVLPDPRNPGRLYLAERIRYRGRRAPGTEKRDKTKTKVVRDRLRRRFLLLKSVDMKPTLNFYESWDQLDGERTKEFASIANRIVKDIADGKLT